MRIGLFAHRLAQSDATGVGRYVHELVAALAAIAVDDAITVATTPEGEPTGWVPPRVRERVVPWPRRPVQLAWCLGTGPRLERALGELDVVHLLHPFPPVRCSAPLVASVHDLFPLERPDWFRRSERWTYRRSLELVVRRARRIVVPSSYAADRVSAVLQVPPARVEVVPLGLGGSFAAAVPEPEIDACCRRYGLERGGYAVSVGAVSTRKNVVALVRAAGRPDAHRLPLVLVGGDGHGAAAVDAEITRLDGRGRVVRTGYLPDRDVAALVHGAAVLAHPALAEGFGMVPLEAMAAGTPVIAARTSSIPEVVGDAARLVDAPEDPASWARALGELIDSADERRELARAGRRRAADFSWERTAQAMLGIYADAARG
ncbi:MAG TPA: glycosyltransferase family 1 protein [Solirubrobacteraceae bacterium]|jgi:glycosyltransferase involved in cell wall biosynthesis